MDADKIAREIDEAIEGWKIGDDPRTLICVYADVIRKHIPPPEVDWAAVCRNAASMMFARYDPSTFSPACGRIPSDAQNKAKWCCDAAIALVAEFQRREKFGGGA